MHIMNTHEDLDLLGALVRAGGVPEAAEADKDEDGANDDHAAKAADHALKRPPCARMLGA